MKNNKCPFCDLKKSGNKIIFSTRNFVFIENLYPIIRGHHLLITKKHVREESKISRNLWKEYGFATKKAFIYIIKKYKKSPFIYINPAQQQSVMHFHKHFMPGIFPILGIEKALKIFLNKIKKTSN